MLNLAEYRQRPALLADWLPWAGLVASGVVLNKDGSFQRTVRFRGPDLDSATQGELIATSARLNNALRRLGSGWALFIEAERRAAADYPHSEFPEALSWLVNEERRAAFEESGNHFESGYHLTLVYQPPEESRARAAGMLYENRPTEGVDWRERLTAFMAETERVLDLLDGVMPEIAWLDDSQTLTYLHSTISTRRYRVAVPEVPFHIDALLADSALVGGLAPMLGDQHLRVATVRGFPTSTWPGILDDLNRLGFAYRWSTRFLCLDKSEAEKELARLRRQWFAKRKNVIALLRETIFQQESPLVDTDASNKAADADAALQELGSDQVAFGYLTATVTVMDADAGAADEKLRMVERVIQGRGFVTIPETLNAVDAWLSSIPGNAYANVRQPIVSTLNLAHLMPVSAVWAGPEKNDHLEGPPLIVTRTDGATPFRLVTHIGDVGHTLVAGPTGMGKSVLLATLAMQFRRYRGSRIFAFDMGRSMRATILGLGGEHYDLGTDGEIAFQPLARIDREGYRTWAAEWIEGRLLHEGVAVGPDEKAAIWSALGSLAGAPVEQRTMTGLSVLLQSNALRQALAPYVLGGAHGKLLDADHDRLGMADVQCFEMEELMHSKAAVMAVLHYLFARFDERFDGAPMLLILDEAWLFLDDPVFAARIRQWLKTLRKKNVSVIFATQSLADIKDSAGDRAADSHDLPGLRPQQPPDRNRRHRAAQARLLLPIPPRQPPVRPRPGAGDAGLRGRIHAARPARHGCGARRSRCQLRSVFPVRSRLAAPSRPRLGGRSVALVPRPRAGLPPYRQPPTGEPAMKLHTPKLAALTVVCLLAFGIAQPAHALFGVGDIVLDPTNLVQNTLTAVRTLEQINNQIRQLQNEVQMLINQARNLASLPSSVVGQLRANLATTQRLIAQAKGLAYDVTSIDREFARLYPEKYAATVSGNQMYLDAQERWKNTLNGLQTTMQMQAQASQNLSDDESVLADLVGKSQSAEGALQAMQAMNQLLALQAKQSIQSQRLQITQDRAASLELARQAAAAERSREVRRRFLGEGTPYTPQSVNFYRD